MVQTLTQDIINTSTKPIIIKAYATWCPHCAKMKPIYEALEKELGQQYTFTEFDVDQAKDLVKQFAITSLPTFITMKNKQEVGRVIGEMSQESLKKFITT
jgi:thioredoxin 1